MKPAKARLKSALKREFFPRQHAATEEALRGLAIRRSSQARVHFLATERDMISLHSRFLMHGGFSHYAPFKLTNGKETKGM